MKIRLGISTCPNDTFAFFPLLEGRLAPAGFELDIRLMDVQELNQQLRAGLLDVGKASFFAALQLAERYVVFEAGSALGFGNGPLLLSGPGRAVEPGGGPPRIRPPERDSVVLCPGDDTTAHLLYRLFYPGLGQVRQVVFSEIAPALVAGQADYGVCIHEGRFTYHRQGLGLVEDLGQRWERETGSPLPLGGILGSRTLGPQVLGELGELIARSVAYAVSHRDEALGVMQRYAQELEPDVIWAHVDLYVNRWTQALGEPGRAALDTLAVRAAAAGLIPATTRLEVVPLLQSVQSTAGLG